MVWRNVLLVMEMKSVVMNDNFKVAFIVVSVCSCVLGLAAFFTNLNMKNRAKEYAEIKNIVSSDERSMLLYKTAMADDYIHRLERNIIFTEFIENNYENSDKIIELLMSDLSITVDEMKHLSFDGVRKK